jgi:K+-sensing histidine kinase KdpD
MGIGLSVSLSIITSHRGRLWAAQNEGHGATFAFSIPRGSDEIKETHNLSVIHTSIASDVADAPAAGWA